MSTWCLLKILHTEPLSGEARRSADFVSLRTSYCLAPGSWRQLDELELRDRVEILLEEAFARRHPRRFGRDEPSPMRVLHYDHEWIEPDDEATRHWTESVRSFRVGTTSVEWHILSWDDPDEHGLLWDALFPSN